MADVKIAKSVKSMKMAPKVNSMLTKEIEFYINYITDFHLIYDWSLFNRYNEVPLTPIWMPDNSKLGNFGKKSVYFTVMIESETS